MDMHAAFEAWAPPGVAWSKWAKPILFSYMRHAAPALPVKLGVPSFDLSAGPTADGATCVVADLPGAKGVALGLALARIGFRPVPLYNALPWALGPDAEAGEGAEALPLVEVWPIVEALRQGAEALVQTPLSAEAAPAFLLDGWRRYGVHAPEPGRFDNRSISFPTDFPTAETLTAHGFHKVVLMQEGDGLPQSDLAHTLLNWQAGGLELFRINVLRLPQVPSFIERVGASFMRHWWCNLMVKCGWMREPMGGFGGILFEPSAG